MSVTAEAYRRAMARVPGPVVVATTVDDSGRRWGFTASSFTSLSLSPPLVLVCLDKNASTHEAFAAADSFLINVLSADQAGVALRFAESGPDRFRLGDAAPMELGLPGIPQAAVRIACSMHEVLDGGDHSILIGRVTAVHVGDQSPLTYVEREFARPVPLLSAGSAGTTASTAAARPPTGGPGHHREKETQHVGTTRTLVIVAHPDLARSRANAAMAAAIGDLDNVTVHDLYAAYPDFRIDVEREQKLVLEYDTVVFQFPIYWYSTPPLLKQWFDKVLTINYAFTFDGTPSRLRGKKAWAAVTVGGNPHFYTPDGFNTVPVEVYLRPLQQTLAICQFESLGHLKVFGLMTGSLSDEELALHAKQYRALLATGGSPATMLAAANPIAEDHEVGRVMRRLAETTDTQPVNA